ncbi:MAG: carbonic anhydrase family protein [Oxalobacter sp.]|nr:MAG: carbonic anhydrase family protein [Oxalobacter sp.]
MLLKRKFLSIALALGAIALSGCSSTGHDHAHAWGYEGNIGAAHWGDLKPEYATCKLGSKQSPIDLTGAKVSKLSPIKFSYKSSQLKIIDNGHTIQTNFVPGSTITVNGKKYNLLQMHFHQPSEETVNGKAYPMNAHLVHKSADGKLAVVGVFMKEGKENSFLKAIWKNIPQQKDKEVAVSKVKINLAKFLPKNKHYYAYTGSLTTPPCSEDVTWMVMKTPVEVSKMQIAAFGKYYSHNARPVQPLNDRVLKVSK